MELGLMTPALLFPAISLLLLVYTNRFLTLANLIRELHKNYKTNPEQVILAQISNLRYRVRLIRDMQVWGIASFFLSSLSMFFLYTGPELVGNILFGGQSGDADGLTGHLLPRDPGLDRRPELPAERTGGEIPQG
jgi:hypothetical protein